MRVNIKQIRKMRKYSEEFKHEMVNAFERGKFSVPQLEKLYGVSCVTIYRWIYKYSSYNEAGFRVVEQKMSSMKKVNALQERVKELEQIVGQKQIVIDFLEKIIELAKAEHGIDIKKNFNTRPSTGSGKTEKK